MNDSSSTTISKWLAESEKTLREANITTARLDCLVLLEDATSKDRSWLLSHSEETLQIEVVKNLNTKIVQRAKHIPLAYIRGHAEFYGREFMVNEHTLVPRPETETIIELLGLLDPEPNTTILDVGTGSGCIAITAKLEYPHATVAACDIDSDCLATTKINAEHLGADITVYKSDLLTSVPSSYNILLTNLPYVPSNFQINTAATHEPAHALFGGKDGLDLYRKLFEQAQQHTDTHTIITESLPFQHDELETIARPHGFAQTEHRDFIQVFRKVNR